MQLSAFTYAKRGAFGALVALLLMGATAAELGPFPTLALERAEAAEEVYMNAPSAFEATREKTQIERVSEAYDEARAAAIVCNAKAAANQLYISKIENRLPVQQDLCDNAMVVLYKMQANRLSTIEMLLSADSLEDFLRHSDYVERISRANLDAINELRELHQKLEDAHEQLRAAKAESDAAMSIAQEALDTERAARAAKQAAGTASPGAMSDGADWNMTEDEFVAAWAPRIDAYLAGSALDGQGTTFARASWRYCVDPRWSPAISNTESSKGAKCIRPYNAWGWGAADSDPYNLAKEWGSWEEAIDAHVRGLSEGYGYTISHAAAKSYCSTWESWYQNTSSEMARI